MILSAGSKCKEIVSTSDCINPEKIENIDDVWRWIHENIGKVTDVTSDGDHGYQSFVGVCNHTKRTFNVNLPMMKLTKSFILTLWEDLKQ